MAGVRIIVTKPQTIMCDIAIVCSIAFSSLVSRTLFGRRFLDSFLR